VLWDNNSSTLILSTSTRGPSVAPAMSAIVAGSPVERRHCPALSLLTAVDTCKASSWAGTRSCPTLSFNYANFPASSFRFAPRRRVADDKPTSSARTAAESSARPRMWHTPLSADNTYPPLCVSSKKKKILLKTSTFSSSRLPFFRLSRAPLFF